MSLHDVGLAAGTVATGVFISSYLPMLVKARRTKDLTSYSPSSLVLANLGNVAQTLYVVTLPPGPLWVLHSFYVVASALMFCWWLRYGRATTPLGRELTDAGSLRGPVRRRWAAVRR